MHEGKSYSTSKAKADAFMRRYAAISRLNIPKPERRKNTVRRLLNAPSIAEERCKKFTLAELKSAIGSMKPKGAPGRDRIAPRFIRALGPEALDFLLSIYNDSWSLGVSPSHWSEALIIPLLKKGKPASQIYSFSPVSLTSCIAKTMERMVANRLAILAESSGWWSPAQAGFRSMRSCEYQVLCMSQSISNGFQTRPASRTVLAFLDFSKAFDTVWRDRLYEILLAKGVPRMMVSWIRGFLTDRRARVRLDGLNGSSMKLQQGVPQGSVLSPLLFLFYINGIRDAAPEGTFISMYGVRHCGLVTVQGQSNCSGGRPESGKQLRCMERGAQVDAESVQMRSGLLFYRPRRSELVPFDPAQRPSLRI